MNDWIQRIVSYIVKLPMILTRKVDMEKRRKLDLSRSLQGQLILNKNAGEDNFTRN